MFFAEKTLSSPCFLGKTPFMDEKYLLTSAEKAQFTDLYKQLMKLVKGELHEGDYEHTKAYLT